MIIRVVKIVKRNIFFQKMAFRLRDGFSAARVGARRQRNDLLFCAEIDHQEVN